MKSVVIIRHAESSWDAITDFERPLNNKGINEAESMGNIIANQIQFDYQIKKEKTIYGASVEKLFNMITKLDNNINSIAFVGHNPALHLLSEELSNEQFVKFPTCSIVKINFDINSWEKIQSGDLEYFMVPERSY